MDSIRDLLKMRMVEEPEEVKLIKKFILDTYESASKVTIRGDALIIAVPSAALANTLRLRSAELKKAANTSMRLVFRIG